MTPFYLIMVAQAGVGRFLEKFPPRQKSASFTIDQVMEKLTAGLTDH